MALAVTILRFLLSFIFLFTSLGKLRRTQEFERAVRNYHLLPDALVRPVSRLLPPFEFTCAAALFAGVAVPIASATAGMLLAIFALAIAANLWRGRRIDCGCAGHLTAWPVSWMMVLRNLALLGCAGTVARNPVNVLSVVATRTGTPSSLPSESGIAAIVVAGTTVMALALMQQWLQLRPRLRPFGV